MNKLAIAVLFAGLTSAAHGADMYVRGSFDGWQNHPLYRAYCTPGSTNSCGYFSSTFAPNGSSHQFKFDRYGNWAENYGDNNTADAYLDRNGANIDLAPHYSTKIAFEYNSNNGRPYFKVHRDDCGAMGVWGGLYNRSQKLFGGVYGYQGDYYCYQTISFEVPGQFYFTDGAATLGDPAGDLNLTVGTTGAIQVPQAGVYKVTYKSNLGHPTYTISRYGSMYVRTSNTSWSNTAMRMVKPFVWSGTVPFTANVATQLKFDAYGDWSVNFGDTDHDRVADAGGGNISLTSATGGNLPVRFNEMTRKYALCVQGHATFDPQLCN